MKGGSNVAFWKVGDLKTEIEESQSNLPDWSRSRKRFFYSSFHSVSLSSLGEQHTGICYREAEFPDLQTERVLFDEPICILLPCRFCWPGNERYREAAVLSGQQATLGSLPPSPSRHRPKCLSVPLNPCFRIELAKSCTVNASCKTKDPGSECSHPHPLRYGSVKGLKYFES